jgi:large subunit ribosomal protein L7/L12
MLLDNFGVKIMENTNTSKSVDSDKRIESAKKVGNSSKSIEERIKEIEDKAAKQVETLKEKQAQIQAKQEKIEARKLTALMKGKRSSDTRRKILAGALVIEIMEKDEAVKIKFMNHIDKYLTRDDDRALFELPVLKK